MRDRKLVVFHVGAHKTGTTLVQQFLQAHQRELRRRRVHYVTRSELSEHVGWGDRLVCAPQGLAALVETFAADRRTRLFVASHENLCGHPFVRGTPGLYPHAGARIDALGGMLAPLRHKVILSVRPQHEFLESYYLQAVNLGGRQPFERWLHGIDLDALSWRPLVENLVRAFGREHVEIVDFGLIRNGPDAYLRHLLSRIDPRLDLRVSWNRALNPSLSEKGLALALAANPNLDDDASRAAVRSFLQRHYSNRSQPRPVLLGSDVIARLRERYDAEFADLVGRLQPVLA